MNRLAAVGCIAVCLVFSAGLSAQTPTITVTPTGTAGVYTLSGQYTAQAQVHPPTGNVAFEDTTYSNAVLASAPFSSSVTSSIVSNGSQTFTSIYGYYYSNVLARDFDGDGKADLLFIGFDQYLHFLKGNGDGTFQTSTDSSVTMQTTLLAVGDWNGDGKLDIAASSGAVVDTNSGPANATTLVRLGNGDGTFQAPTQFTETIPQSAHQNSLKSGDFNGDGKLDLFSTGYYPSHLYLGNGDGTFAAAVNTIGASGPVADFNNDGRADIYESNYTLLGLSNGTFQSVSHTSGPIGTQVTAADFNHDGKLDVAGFSGVNATISLGNGDGTFQTASTYNIDPGPVINPYNQNDYQYTYWSTASGDFNGDGVPDVAFLGSYTTPLSIYFQFSLVAVLFGRPDGSFASPQIFTDTSFVFSNPPNFLSVDLTGNGPDTLLQLYIDYTGSDYSTPTPAVHRYTATNTYTATATNVIVSPGGTHQVQAHYSGDANYGAAISTTQAVTGSTSQATLSLAISPNPSTYGARADMTVTVTPCTVGSYSCDSDWVDIYDGSTAVTSGYPSGGVAHVIWRNFSQGTHLITARIRGNTNLSSATSNAVTLTVGPPLGIVSTLTLGNPQQVGSTYTLSAQLSTPALEVAPSGSVSFVDLTANNSSLATATFGPPTPVLQPTQYTGMSYLPGSLYAADFDNDGKADLIYQAGGGNSVTFLRGNGDGTFSGTPTANGRGGPKSFAVADFDHDGKLDVVLTGTSGTSLLRGNGDGTFATPTTITSGDTSNANVFAGDFNGDGKQDIYNGGTVFLGNGDGTFQSGIATGAYPQLVADFNQDGRTDLFAYGTLYLGQADGTFTAIPAPNYSASFVADFNHDGKPDLLTNAANGITANAVVLGNGDGTFQAPIPVDLSDPNGYSSGIYFTGDFNGDGKADLGVITIYPSSYYHTSGHYYVVATFGDGTGAFGNKTASSGDLNDDQSSPPLAVPTYLPDFNGDAASDIPIYTQAYYGTSTGGIAITLYTTPTVYTATATGITVSGPPYGYHSIQATYPGDANYLDESSGTTSIIAPIPVTVMLAVNRNPINIGQQVTFTATLSPFSEGNQSTNGGTIYFSDGSTVLGSGTLNNGLAQFTTSSLSAGSHSITAQFPGFSSSYSFAFASATSVPLSMQVGSTAVNIAWPPPAAITYGTALSSTQLNASTATAGSFAYSPAAGTVLTPGTQTLSATFTPTDTVTYSTTTATVTLVVNKLTPSIAVTQTSPTTTGTNVGTATTLLATLSASYGTPTGTVTFYDGSTSIGTGTLSGSTVSITTTFTTAGTHTITAVYAGNTNFNTVTSAGFSEVVSKTTPTITWPTPAAITYGAPLSTTQLNATSAVAGAFVYSPAAGVVLTGGSQTLSVTFVPTDTNTYSNATANVTLVVNKATPSITWATPAAITYGTALSATQLNATSTAAGSFVYSPAAGTVPGAGPQNLSVTFTPTDTTSYTSATATTTLAVNRSTPSITWATPAAITYGTALSATQLNATSSVAGTFVYSPAAGTVLGAGPQNLSVTFTPTDATSYNSATATTTLVINKSTPSITWATPAAITYGTALSATQLNATSSVAGSFVYSPAAGTVLGAGPQNLSVTFTPTDATSYNSATATTTLVVNKSTPSITWASPAAITYGTALSATQLNATSSVAGSFVYSPGAGTVPGVGTQTLSVTFTPIDPTSYNSATATTTLVVNKTTPSITWATPAAITYGTALSATQLNATSPVAGAFTYSPAAGAIPGAGLQALATAFTPTDTATYSSANASTALVVNKATPSITVIQTSPITIGVGAGVATTFRAALTASYGTPTGTVGFYEGTTLLGSAPLISGAASVTTTFSTTGVHTITALYTGDANFNTVTSAPFNETVVLFGIGLAANPTTLTIKQGQSGTAIVTATPTGNYSGTLTFSCGNLPSSVSCSFAPATLTFNGDNQPQTTTITVSTRTTSAALRSSSNLRLASILALPLLAFGLRRRRMLQHGLLVLFAAMLLLPTTGCGGSPTITTSNPPATGQQTVTINAQTTANGGSTQSFNFSIVIEP